MKIITHAKLVEKIKKETNKKKYLTTSEAKGHILDLWEKYKKEYQIIYEIS